MIGKTTNVKTIDLTPEMLRVAIAAGWTVHVYKSFYVTTTHKCGVIKVTPREWTAGGLRLYAARKINSTQAVKGLLNVYGKRVIKDTRNRRMNTLAYL